MIHPLLPRSLAPARQTRSVRCIVALLCLLVLARATPAHAEQYLSMEPMHGKKIRIDGMLRDWPGGFAKLKSKSKVGGETLVAYDEANVYLALSIEDAKVIRTKNGGQTEDRLTLEIRVPGAAGGNSSTTTISVYPGDPGKLPALVKVDGKAVQAEAVENHDGKTLIVEAKLPWSALPALKRIKVGLRGRIAYQDAQTPGSVRTTYETTPAASLQPLTLEPETGLIQALLEPKDLGLKPAREVFGDIAGDDQIERVAIFGHFVAIVGSGYKDGKQFYYNELDVGSADRIKRLSLVDFSGDGKAEIVLQKRIGPDSAYRDVLIVFQIGADGAPLQVFAHEVSLVATGGAVHNDVKITGSGSSAKIRIAQGKAEGFDPGTFSEPTIGGGIQSALLPWESVQSRTFQWKGAALSQVEEKTGTPKVAPARRATTAASAAGAAPAPPPPRPPTSAEMLDRVYALYRKDRGVGTHKPRFDLVTDVVEDSRMERVLVHDRDLVVFGPGFREGQTYTYLTIGVKESKDILSVTTRDLVGDGKAVIIVHAVLRAQASKQLGGDEVQRQALFVYKVQDGALARIFAAETGRASKGKRVLGSALFVPNGRGVAIELRPLRALGWTEQTYPFPEDTTAAGGLEPLLLPWGQSAPRRYVYRKGAFVADAL